jgi:hypothetical protein
MTTKPGARVCFALIQLAALRAPNPVFYIFLTNSTFLVGSFLSLLAIFLGQPLMESAPVQ